MISAGKRPLRKLLASASVAAVLLTGARPAHADPTIPTLPDLRVMCQVWDDPKDWGDGIDWWRFRILYSNKGTAHATKKFSIRVDNVWTYGNIQTPWHVVEAGPMGVDQLSYKVFWITRQVKDAKSYGAYVDLFNDVTEFQEWNNACYGWQQ